MSKPERGSKPVPKKNSSKFPWLVFILLLITIYIFWIYPLQKGPQPVRVTFEPAASNTK